MGGGSLLASESFEANQELEITTDKAIPGKITVTQLRYSVSNEKKSYFANSHVNIEKGKHMILKRRSDTSTLQQTGKLHVTVSNVPFYDHFSNGNSRIDCFPEDAETFHVIEVWSTALE